MTDRRKPSEATRREYLEAIGIDLWYPRDATPVAEPASDDAHAGDTVSDGYPAAGSGVDDPAPTAALDWAQLQQRVAGCTLCRLHESRTQTVFGVGDRRAELMIIGEAPGQEEDRRGEPFVGRAGKLLDQMLRAVGLGRDTVFIANTLKCRPPNNRDPADDEARACRPYLDRQIELLQPRVVLAVGRIAAQKLLSSDAPLGRLRGKQHFLKDGTLPLVVTYHPAYLLRSPSQKRKAWQDLCAVRDILNDSRT